MLDSEQAQTFIDLLVVAGHLIFLGLLSNVFARILSNAAHLFYAEIRFESLPVFFRCEGTFSESKISTGTGIHDSTRSENTLVRSSITLWIIVSQVYQLNQQTRAMPSGYRKPTQDEEAAGYLTKETAPKG